MIHTHIYLNGSLNLHINVHIDVYINFQNYEGKMAWGNIHCKKTEWLGPKELLIKFGNIKHT